jgi:hypothetical protein
MTATDPPAILTAVDDLGHEVEKQDQQDHHIEITAHLQEALRNNISGNSVMPLKLQTRVVNSR